MGKARNTAFESPTGLPGAAGMDRPRMRLMKLSESKFCVESDCEELVHVLEPMCPCGCTHFYELSWWADPGARRQRWRIVEGQRSAKLLRFDCNGQAKADERLNAL